MSQQDMDLLLWLHAEAVELRRRDVEFHMRIRMEVEAVLDEALGTEPEDGAGEGLVGDVALLAKRAAAAEASRRDWAAEADRLQHAYDETVQALTEEIRWQKDAYRDGHKDVRTEALATGRTIGMEDARRTLTETFARSLPLCAVHPEVDR